ncbi:hypothetical protein HPB50_010212 [Hyalomma asiaticum]|uniref:Uncharacterized protein n=1 Tax=Hyalomma asiaticum TaxID=266040 RepID=A0ACB7RRG8_HYAAI|nr:hypothetical protein HPB50_010212 [Hyalomma asiaticum]
MSLMRGLSGYENVASSPSAVPPGTPVPSALRGRQDLERAHWPTDRRSPVPYSGAIVRQKPGLEEPRLVYPRILEGRSSDGKLMLHVHDELTLNLEQATVAAPQLRVLNEEDGASVIEMTGIVGPNHRIEPAATMERSVSGLIPHMVYEIQHAKVYDKALSIAEEDDNVHASNTLLHDTETLQKFLTYAQRKKSDFGNPDLVFLVTGRDVATGSNWATSATGLEEPRLVYPRLLEGRSSDGKLLLHLDDDLMLNLEQASVAAPQLRVIEEVDGASVTEMVSTQTPLKWSYVLY